MTIALRGALQKLGVTNGANLTLTFNVTPSEGDVVVVFGGHGAAVTTLTPPGSDYTEIGIHTGSAPIYGAWYKVMGASPDSDVLCYGSGNALDGTGYASYVFSGADTTTPMDVTPTTAGPTTSSNPDGASITPANAGTWVLSLSGADKATGNIGSLAGYSNQLQVFGNDTNDIQLGGGTFAWTTGAEDPPAWSAWSPAGMTWYSITVALRELGAGGGGGIGARMASYRHRSNS